MRCKICGKRFTIRKKIVYWVLIYDGMAISPNKPSIFEAVDCTRCGCQHILNKRETHFVENGCERVIKNER